MLYRGIDTDGYRSRNIDGTMGDRSSIDISNVVIKGLKS